MKKKKIEIKLKNKKICLDIFECGFFELARGLMFRRREKAPALLFDIDNLSGEALTGLFVFFPFYVLWLDEKNNVSEIKFVKPFTFYVNSKKPFSKIVEIPVSKKYSKIIKILVDNKKFK